MYQALQSQLTGGLSIVFSRLAIAGKTKIRPHQIKDPETCRKCLGVDANTLCLFAIQQNKKHKIFCALRGIEKFLTRPLLKIWSCCVPMAELDFSQRKQIYSA